MYVAIRSIDTNDHINSLSTDSEHSQSEDGSSNTTEDDEVSELQPEVILNAKKVHIKFLITTVEISKMLVECDTQVFLEACNMLYADHSKMMPLFPSDYITGLNRIEVILKRLAFLWSWHNCSVLRSLLEACNCQSGLTLLDNFESQIDRNQPIELFPIPQLSLKMTPSSSSAYTVLSIRSRHYQNQQVPLQYTMEVAEMLMETFSISQHALQLLAVKLNPVVMYWMIPKNIVSHISKEIQQHTNALRNHDLSEITVYPNVTLFPENNWLFAMSSCDHVHQQVASYVYD